MSLLVIHESGDDHVYVEIVKDVPAHIMQLVNTWRETAPLVFDDDDEFGAWFHDESTPKQSVASTNPRSYPPPEYAISVFAVVILRSIT